MNENWAFYAACQCGVVCSEFNMRSFNRYWWHLFYTFCYPVVIVVSLYLIYWHLGLLQHQSAFQYCYLLSITCCNAFTNKLDPLRSLCTIRAKCGLWWDGNLKCFAFVIIVLNAISCCNKLHKQWSTNTGLDCIMGNLNYLGWFICYGDDINGDQI